VPLTVYVAVSGVGVLLSVTLIVAVKGPTTFVVPLTTTVPPPVTLTANPDGNAPELSAAV
jgi:hypothetical protein